MVGPLDAWLTAPGLVVIYDGECPFCSAYVRMLRLKEAAGAVTLVDARQRPDVTDAMKARGLDINQTMLAVYGGKLYPGADAMTLLSLMSSRSGFANRMLARLFADPGRARRLYPLMRWGRGIALKLLGRQPIS